MNCDRCGIEGAEEYTIEMRDGKGEPLKVTTVNLCVACSEAVADDLLRFKQDHTGVIDGGKT